MFFAFAGMALTAKSQHINLVKDINNFTNSTPSNYNYHSINNSFAVLNGVAYFNAKDGVGNSRLWRSDGTAAGTKLVKDIPSATGVFSILPFNNKLLFAAENYSVGQVNLQLWASDGTSANTKKLTGALRGEIFGQNRMAVLNNKVFFIAGTGYFDEQLWVTDGTAAGTVKVASLYSSAFKNGYNVQGLTVYNNAVYFAMQTDNGGELYCTDGTKAGTFSVKKIGPNISGPSTLTVVNGKMYFHDGYSIWQSDGTTAGTAKVASLNVVGGSIVGQDDANFPVLKNSLFLLAETHTSNTVDHYDLYRYNTEAPAGVEFVSRVVNGNGISITNEPVLKDSLLFFISYDDNYNQQLWSTTGTAASNTLLAQAPPSVDEKIMNLCVAGDQLYFSFDTDSTGYELWRTDGTVAGTKQVKDIYPGIYSGNPYNTTPLGNKLMFAANDGITGDELWISDGTQQGTNLVKDINTLTTGDAVPTLYNIPNFNPIVNGKITFGAYDEKNGNELWVSNGTVQGTQLTKDIEPGLNTGFGLPGGVLNNNFYYFKRNLFRDIAIWKTDGTTGGTKQVQNIHYTASSAPGTNMPLALDLKCGDTILYFLIANTSASAMELWAGNGTAPAHLVSSFPHYFPGNTRQPLLFVAGNTAYFIARDDTNGLELWTSDGTAQGTKVVKDINPSAADAYPQNLTLYNNKLYFAAFNGVTVNLWATNGTEAGTQMVTDVVPGVTTPFMVAGSRLYFPGVTDSTGDELWAVNGNTVYQVKDVYPGSGSSNISNMINVNGRLYFTADDGEHGAELWKTNGTADSTVLVKDITPGAAGSDMYYLTAGNKNMFFLLNDTLWMSNGTAAGTGTVGDANLQGLTGIGGLTMLGDTLFFTAYSFKYGNELYAGVESDILPLTFLRFSGSLVKNDAQLKWVTANEINTGYFNVERSVNAINFATIGKVAAMQNSAGENTYNFIDAGVTSLGLPVVYYRLKEIDKDGAATFSNIVKLPVGPAISLAVAPNPAHKIAYITSSSTAENAIVSITDMNGKVLYSVKQNLVAGARQAIDVSHFAAGTYNVTVSTHGTVTQTKLVLQ